MQTELGTARFSIFSLDARRRELRAHGKSVALHARAFDVLLFLIEHRHESVSHAEILASVWTGRAVSDGNLAVQLSALRKALADAGGDDKLIVTLPNRRYRFVGEVDEAGEPEHAGVPPQPVPQKAEVLAAAAAPPQAGGRQIGVAGRKLWIGLGMVAGCFLLAGWMAVRARHPGAPAAPRLSLVVLPFRNASADRSLDDVADAITDDLTADLAHIPASTVIARQSAQAVQHETPQQIGRHLNVGYIVAGSITPEEGQYHITASLIDAASGRQLWTTQFDPPRDHVSEVRSTIVRRIAGPLNVAIDTLESGRDARDRPDDPGALDLFFQARSILDARETLSSFQAAHALLLQAIAKQPAFADAQAELGWMLLRQVTTLSDPAEAADLREARQAIRQALAVSPQNTRAIAARALEQEIGGDCVGAQQNARRALVLEPSSVDARRVLASCAQREMRFDEAAADYEAILQLDPANPNNTVLDLIIGTLRLVQGQVDQAATYLTLAKDDGATPTADLEPSEQAELLLIAAHDIGGRRDQARAEYAAYANRYAGRAVWRIGSYFDAAWLKIDGLQRALAGLQDAGMPVYSDEDELGLDRSTSCPDGAFAPTPRVLPGGRVILTAEFAKLLAGGNPPQVIDVGLGIASKPGWVLYNHTTSQESPAEFTTRIVRERAPGDMHRPIAVLGEGVRGCTAFDVSAALIRAGYVGVLWYRGGEEAWQRRRTEADAFSLAKVSAH